MTCPRQSTQQQDRIGTFHPQGDQTSRFLEASIYRDTGNLDKEIIASIWVGKYFKGGAVWIVHPLSPFWNRCKSVWKRLKESACLLWLPSMFCTHGDYPNDGSGSHHHKFCRRKSPIAIFCRNCFVCSTVLQRHIHPEHPEIHLHPDFCIFTFWKLE